MGERTFVATAASLAATSKAEAWCSGLSVGLHTRKRHDGPVEQSIDVIGRIGFVVCEWGSGRVEAGSASRLGLGRD